MVTVLPLAPEHHQASTQSPVPTLQPPCTSHIPSHPQHSLTDCHTALSPQTPPHLPAAWSLFPQLSPPHTRFHPQLLKGVQETGEAASPLHIRLRARGSCSKGTLHISCSAPRLHSHQGKLCEEDSALPNGAVPFVPAGAMVVQTGCLPGWHLHGAATVQ